MPTGILAGFGGTQDGGFSALRAGRDTIRRTGRIRLILLSLALGETGGGELFAIATFFHELFFQGGDLLVEQVVGLVAVWKLQVDR